MVGSTTSLSCVRRLSPQNTAAQKPESVQPVENVQLGQVQMLQLSLLGVLLENTWALILVQGLDDLRYFHHGPRFVCSSLFHLFHPTPSARIHRRRNERTLWNVLPWLHVESARARPRRLRPAMFLQSQATGNWSTSM